MLNCEDARRRRCSRNSSCGGKVITALAAAPRGLVTYPERRNRGSTRSTEILFP